MHVLQRLYIDRLLTKERTAVDVRDDDTVDTLTERIKGVERPQLVEYVDRTVREGFTINGRRCTLGNSANEDSP